MTGRPAGFTSDARAGDTDGNRSPWPGQGGGAADTAAFSPLDAFMDWAFAPGAAEWALCSEPESASAARCFISTTLRDWALERLADDVAVVASELVTNAFRYGQSRSPRSTPAEPIQLGLVRNGTHLLCAVADPGDAVPVLKEPDHLAESGRGLHVIACLSEAWGWTPPSSSGKVVWAMFTNPGPPAQPTQAHCQPPCSLSARGPGRVEPGGARGMAATIPKWRDRRPRLRPHPAAVVRARAAL